MANELQGKRIAFIAADGVERVELTEPWRAIQEAGATPELISLKPGTIRSVDLLDPSEEFDVDKTYDDVSPDDYDGIVIPGGVANPDFERQDPRAVAFVRAFFDAQKPIASICHGPWMLIEADVVRGRSLAAWPSLKTDIRNAGGTWVDEEVHTEDGIVTSRKPDDLPAFCRKMVEEFTEGRHTRRSAAAA
jgi:protease I